MLIGSYGSLKKGFHNHAGLGNAIQKETETIKGIMQIPYSYPYLFNKNEIETNEKEREYELEIYDIDKDIFKSISEMERGAGYKEEKIKTKSGEATVWITEPELFNPKKEIAEAYTMDIYNKEHKEW